MSTHALHQLCVCTRIHTRTQLYTSTLTHIHTCTHTHTIMCTHTHTHALAQVSSPGAERTLLLPQELDRFGSLPLRVEYTDPAGTRMNQVFSCVCPLLGHPKGGPQGLVKSSATP